MFRDEQTLRGITCLENEQTLRSITGLEKKNFEEYNMFRENKL